jgi:hypothetical protein
MAQGYIGYTNATRELNKALKNAGSNRLTWQRDIVPIVNRPKFGVCYAEKSDKKDMEQGYIHLSSLLR